MPDFSSKRAYEKWCLFARSYPFSVVLTSTFRYAETSAAIDCKVALKLSKDLLNYVKTTIASFRDIEDFNFNRDVSIQFPTATDHNGLAQITMTINMEISARQFFSWFGVTCEDLMSNEFTSVQFKKWQELLAELRDGGANQVTALGPYHRVNWNRQLLDKPTWLQHEKSLLPCVKKLFHLLELNLNMDV